MNTLDIVKALHYHPCTSRYFLGVFPCDQLPVTVHQYPAILVANTDTSKQPGTHWVCVYISKDKHGFFWDSYGLAPIQPYFISFLNRNCSTWIHNPHHLQGLLSMVCGQYCCVFLAYVCNMYNVTQNPIVEFANFFSYSDHNHNDHLVLKKFKCWFHNYCKQACNSSMCCYYKTIQECCSQY